MLLIAGFQPNLNYFNILKIQYNTISGTLLQKICYQMLLLLFKCKLSEILANYIEVASSKKESVFVVVFCFKFFRIFQCTFSANEVISLNIVYTRRISLYFMSDATQMQSFSAQCIFLRLILQFYRSQLYRRGSS